ncbi:MAG TPA: class I SAM-dependent methyltransferase [Acidimicrobiia bacterium]|jgi:hypothetical protein
MWHTKGRTWTLFDPEFVGDVLDPERASALWAGHRWFAYDLVRWGRPEVVVELGTQYGPSFFAFCQAVRDEGCATRLHAIDTWKGDTFTGAYGEEVFSIVQRIDAEAFADLDTHLHRCLFRDALDEFGDESVDLLHIDGCHDYASVADDFRTWLPKVAQNGIVLLHDVDAHTDMGSAVLWRELASEHPSLLFPHSLGLGVLFPRGVAGFDYLFGDEFTRWRSYYASRAGDFLGQLRDRDQTRMIAERDAVIADQDRLVAARNATIAAQEATIDTTRQELAERVAHIRVLEDMLHHPFLKVANRARKAVARARRVIDRGHGTGA